MSDSSAQAVWLDRFLLWDATAVAALFLFDFFIGKENRGRIRDTVGWWGLVIEDKPYAELILRLVRSCNTFLVRIFGQIKTPRYWISVGIVATLISVLLATIVYMIMIYWFKVKVEPILERNPDTNVVLTRIPVLLEVARKLWEHAFRDLTFRTLLYSFPLVAILCGCLLVITTIIFDRLNNDPSVKNFVTYIVANLAIIVGFFIIQSCTVYYASQLYITIVGGMRLEIIPHEQITRYLLVGSLPGVLVASIPMVIFLLISILLFIMKVTVRWWKLALAIVLQRLYETDQGIISIIAAFVGGAAKLIQAWSK